MRVRGFPLPLGLLAAMIAIASALELAIDGRWNWLPKSPLVLLLTLALARSRRRGESA